MASWSQSLVPSPITSLSLPQSSSNRSLSLAYFKSPSLNCMSTGLHRVKNASFGWRSSSIGKKSKRPICRAAEYKFPDPIPEFADSETEKFKEHLVKKLSKKQDLFGDSLDEVVGVCTEIFSTFLHSEYGGPGTLLVIPFIDMADTINERGLPGGPQAARAAVKWAQNHVDTDWKEWTGTN